MKYALFSDVVPIWKLAEKAGCFDKILLIDAGGDAEDADAAAEGPGTGRAAYAAGVCGDTAKSRVPSDRIGSVAPADPDGDVRLGQCVSDSPRSAGRLYGLSCTNKV